MELENYKHINEWDYQPPDSMIKYQNDWNQTLLTKINQTSAMICKTSYRGGANQIEINSNLLPLIETLEYYQPTLREINHKVVVINDTLDDDIIIMKRLMKVGEWEELINSFEENSKFMNIPYVPLVFEEYEKGLCGYIKILNRK